MSVVFFLLSALFLTSSFAGRENKEGKRSRPNKNGNKLRIVIEESCCDSYRSIRREIFENYQCLERSKTSNKDLKFRRDCVIYAKINGRSNRCYEKLRDNECVRMIHFEPIFYTDAVDYSDDICATQDVSQDDPCLLVYDLSFGADGTQCASTYLQDAVKPFYHLTYWYPNDPMDPYSYTYLDTTGVSNVANIDVWILDSGIDRNHVEFTGIDIEKIGYEIGDPEVFSNHGTAVASNAIGNNVGIARGFTIKDCPVCQAGTSCYYEDIENCMMEVLNYYSSRPGRRFVINMSFGGSTEGDYAENFDDMVEAGGILVAAAGNSRTNNDLSPFYPANNPLVISIGGYNQDRNMYSAVGGSNYGTNTVNYYAAAQNNLVALASDYAPSNSNEMYTYFEGTSFASPIVTGEVANILARDLSLTVEDVRAELDLRVIGNVLNCPVESCPMIEGYCNVEGATRNPTETTTNPTMEPTQNPTQTSINPTMAPTLPNSCLTNICQNVNIAINDNLVYTSSINIDMSDIFQVSPQFKSMKVQTQGTHTWQGDLRMTLTSPDNTQILLVDNVGSGNDDFDITFSDDAVSFPSNLNVNGDEYKPEEPLSTFNLQSPIGSWIFTLADEAGGDQGIWESWCITEICFYHLDGTASPTSTTNTPSSNPTANPIEYSGCEFGLYREDLLPSDPSWQRMTLFDWNSYRNDIITFYQINQGVPIIQTFERDYCCMKTSDNFFVWGQGLGVTATITLCHTSNTDTHFEGDVYKFSDTSSGIIYDSLSSVTSFTVSPTCGSEYHTELFVRCDTTTANPTSTTINPTVNPSSIPTTNPTSIPTTNPTSNPITINSTCITDICRNVNMAINDFTIYSSSIDLNETDIGAILPRFLSMKVQTQGTHTWQGDLRMTLISPDNTQILLVDDVGGGYDNFDITFSDDAVSFPFNLNVNGDEYQPAEPFSTFYFEYVLGSWTFTLADELGGDQGIWESWCITELCFYDEFEETPSPTGNPIEEPEVRCCRATPEGREINYSCRGFNRRQCNNDELCRYRANLEGC